jgi:crossover junction endodeoxyribonuclease RuvC
MKHDSSVKNKNTDHPIILGVDPGTRVSGYGVICIQDHKYIPLDYGCIRPPPKYKLSERYLVIYDSIIELIEKHQPTALVVEMQFMYKNAQSALKLGMARGAVMIAAKKRGLPIFEYAPTVAKRAVVGNGRASKYQVQGMVKQILKLAAIPQPEDAADALALAICHAQSAPHLREEV